MAMPAAGDAASTSERGDACGTRVPACMTNSRTSRSSQIPAAGRERLLAQARQRLAESINWPNAVVPVTAEGWVQSLTDAGLNGIDRLLPGEFDGLLDPVNLTEAASLRRTSTRLADRAANIVEDLACLATLSPPGATEAGDLRNALLSQGDRQSHTAVSNRPSMVRRRWPVDVPVSRLIARGGAQSGCVRPRASAARRLAGLRRGDMAARLGPVATRRGA